MSTTSDREAPAVPVGAPSPAARPAAGPSSSAAVDASMRLLREVMDHPLDPAYAMAARHRSPSARNTRTVVVTLLLALVCGWIATQGVAELRLPEPGQASGRSALEREINRRTAEVDDRHSALQRLQLDVAAAQAAQLTSPEDQELASRVQQLALAAGEVAVIGPGLRVTMRDAPSAQPSSAVVDPRDAAEADAGRVLDRDVQVVVNSLWMAGAEAISINGHRLTAVSAIRSAGEAILVDFRPLVPPYVISAIGDPLTLQGRFTGEQGGSYLQNLRDNYGVDFEIAAAERLRLPGAGGFDLRSASPPASPGTSTPGTPITVPSGAPGQAATGGISTASVPPAESSVPPFTSSPPEVSP